MKLPTMQEIREEFQRLLKEEEYFSPKGEKTVEILGVSFVVDHPVLFGELDYAYIDKELEWYLSQSLNVYDIPKTPIVWKKVCDRNGNINSNYGWVIYSKKNGEQFKNCVRSLRKDKDSRRSMMIYTRPEMQVEYNKDGMSDFMCTNNVQVFIRNDKLVYLFNQRSCDVLYGFKNDVAWHMYVQQQLVKELKKDYENLEIGDMIAQFGSLHVYEKHFDKIEIK
jgi:thymidylate synthase